MRKLFDKQLKELELSLAEICDYYELTFDKFNLYIKNFSKDILKEIISKEDFVNSQLDQIEKNCLNLMIKEHPFASDFRFIQTSIKLKSNLRRLYSHIVEAALILNEMDNNADTIILTKRFIHLEKHMLQEFKQAFMERDKKKAYNTIKIDNEIDALFEKSIKGIIEKQKEGILTAIELSDFVLYFKYFERIGDRLVKISSLIMEL